MPKIQDFQLETVPGQALGYWSYKTNEWELTMEPCTSGFDVALYDLNRELLLPKRCTDINVKGWTTQGEVLVKALVHAKGLLDEYESKLSGK